MRKCNRWISIPSFHIAGLITILTALTYRWSIKPTCWCSVATCYTNVRMKERPKEISLVLPLWRNRATSKALVSSSRSSLDLFVRVEQLDQNACLWRFLIQVPTPTAPTFFAMCLLYSYSHTFLFLRFQAMSRRTSYLLSVFSSSHARSNLVYPQSNCKIMSSFSDDFTALLP